MASESVENYVKCIYALQRDEGRNEVSTNAIADRLDTKASSVTDMLKKLRDQGLVDYKKYKGAQLTEQGKNLAIAIVRRHRLWEVFLVDTLGFRWDEVHELAEQLEHIDSEELTKRLDDFLGNPSFDPHGDPIPDQNGKITEPLPRIALDCMEPGQSGIVVGVEDSSAEFLQYLDSVRLTLGVRVKVLNRFDFDRSVLLRTDDGERQVSLAVARNLLLRKITS
jgi:DtxR family Mn-dependent transcriptional regulator